MNAVAAMTIVLIVAAVVVALAARGLDRRRRRRSTSVRIHVEIAAALVRDPALAGLTVRPSVHVGTDDRLTIVLVGLVPSLWYRYAARRTVERELRRLGAEAAVVDRLQMREASDVSRRTA